MEKLVRRTVTMRFTEDEWSAIKFLAHKNGEKMSPFVCKLVRESIKVPAN